MSTLICHGKAVAILFLLCNLTGCVTYTSACHELSAKNQWELNGMIKKAKTGSYKRHLILLEGGNEVSSRCRSFYINEDDYNNLPESAVSKCYEVSGRSSKYCTIYSIDGDIKNQPVDL